jgi:hypothetical protein
MAEELDAPVELESAIRAYRATQRLNETAEGSALVMYERPAFRGIAQQIAFTASPG